jgi:hypothetical protein
MPAYLRDPLAELAGRPTKDEAIEEIEAVLERVHADDPARASIIADLTAERR